MKTNQRLRRNLHLLSSRNPIHSGADAAPGNRTDSSTFPATQKSPKDSPNRSPAPGLNRCILPPPIPLFGKRIRHHIHRMVHRINPSQLNR